MEDPKIVNSMLLRFAVTIGATLIYLLVYERDTGPLVVLGYVVGIFVVFSVMFVLVATVICWPLMLLVGKLFSSSPKHFSAKNRE